MSTIQKKRFRFSLAMILLACTAPIANAQGSGLSVLIGETACYAGCGGDARGCQASGSTINFVATGGNRLYPDTLVRVRRYDKEGSPGLANEPEWIVTRYPSDDNRPFQMTIRPNAQTCIGNDKHTQGITTFVFELTQGPK